MKLTYNYDKVNWKEVKEGFDKEVLFFELEILYKEKVLIFQPGFTNSKRVKFSIFIDGTFEGKWVLNNHEYMIFMNKKLVTLPKKLRDYYVKYEKGFKKLGFEKWALKNGHNPYFYTPIYDNITQIRKMIEKL